jgi:hypothetical protein
MSVSLAANTQAQQSAVRALYFAETQWRVCWSRWFAYPLSGFLVPTRQAGDLLDERHEVVQLLDA